MKFNLHTHTFRCHHAEGTEEEIVKKAIDCGIERLGFSDHVPFVFPDGFESSYRIKTSEVCQYVSEIKRLKEEYRGVIDLKIGFEMEYYPLYFKQMLSNAIDYGAEYLILGQHFLYNEYPNGIGSSTMTDDVAFLNEYVSNVVDAIKSGVFTYVAHPDIAFFVGDEGVYFDKMREICIASRENSVPLEINFLGIRANRHYPNQEFWKLAGEEQSPVTFGCDAHTVESVADKKSLEIANEIVHKYGLNYIGEPTLKPLRKKY